MAHRTSRVHFPLAEQMIDERNTALTADHYYRLHNGNGCKLFNFAMPGFRAMVVNSHQAGETLFEHCEPHHRIIVTLGGGTDETIAEVKGAPTVRRADRAGSVSIIPADTARRVVLRNSSLWFLTIAISPDFADGAPVDIPLLQNGRDDWLWRAAAAFEDAARTGASALEHEGLALAIARHVQRLEGSPRRLSTGLDPAALRRVVVLMQDRIADSLSLADLAVECGLSISAFGRAFRQSTGMTPHRYFTALRMDQAKALLRRKAMPLAHIAGVVGYSDQAHFTTAFARHTGVPPARWRELHLV
jgi:AraC-like DNA-binding protein